MATDASKAIKAGAAAMAATVAAAGGAVEVIANLEGYVPASATSTASATYLDSAKIATDCWGRTGPTVKMGQVTPLAVCTSALAQDVLKHAIGIMPCLPLATPYEVRRAFIITAYNIGIGGFCGSSMSRLALTGDFKGACAALDKWVKIKTSPVTWRVLPGLQSRRDFEQSICLKGLA